MSTIHIEDYNVIDDVIYEEMMDGYLNGIEAYDPQVGSLFQVNGIGIDSNGKGLTAIIQNDVNVKINFADEYLYIKDVLLADKDFANKKELHSYIISNQEDIEERLSNIKTYVSITQVLNGTITGSISEWNKSNIENQFKYQLEVNEEVDKISRKNRKTSDELLENLRYYQCRIHSRNEGGYLGYIDGVEVFIPGSMAHNKKIEDYDKLLGETIPVMIENYAYDRNIYIASFKRYIQYQIPDMLEELDRNDILTGTITGIAPFGIFFNFKDYLNGLLHVSEMNEDTFKKFEDGDLKNGDTLDFYIKSYTKSKIILTEKSYQEVKEAWDKLVDMYEGKTMPLKVIKKVQSGFLFELDGGNNRGLLYDIEADKFGFRFKIGETYDVLIDSMDFETGKIFLKYPFKD